MNIGKRLLLTAIATLMLAGAAQAQTPSASGPSTPAPPAPNALRNTPAEPFRFLSRADIARLAFRPGPVNSTVVADHETNFIEFVQRGDSSNSTEMHVHWIDYIVVLAGEGTLTHGGVVANPTTTNPAEPRGPQPMTGGTVQQLRPGDFVIIPTGLWHSFSATPGNTLNYVIFKQRF